MTTKRVYGIDLGTTYSCIAHVDEHGKPVVIANAENELTTPSVVFFESADNIVVGQSAKEVTSIHEGRVVSTIKRSMGDPHAEFALDGNVYKPQDISSFILRKVVNDAQNITGDTITDVVITCPAYFGLNQKEATKQAGTLAGLNVLYVIPEPTAAAIAYGMEQESDQTILVYDLGGGTFDVTLIEIKEGAITVITTGGDDQLGGKNWDDAIVNYFAQQFEAEKGVPASEILADSQTYQDLLNAAEKCKKKLSSMMSFKDRVLYGGDRVQVELTREKFDEITSDYLERTISLTEEMLERAREKGHVKIDKLLLVGGSSYMPQVIDRVKRAFPFEVKLYDPNQSVAKGAAMFGYKVQLEDQIKIRIAEETGRDIESINLDAVSDGAKEEAERQVAQEFGMALPGLKKLTGTRITNISSKSFGIVVMDTARDMEVVNNLIVIDDQVPCEVTRQFGTYEDNQMQADLRLMENQVRTGPNDTVSLAGCNELDKAALVFNRPLPKGSPVEIKFKLSADGLLIMEGKDLMTGGQIQVQRTTDSIMSKEELEESKSRNLAMQVS